MPRAMIRTTIGYTMAPRTRVLIFSAFSTNSVKRFQRHGQPPPISPALIMLTNSLSKTFGCWPRLRKGAPALHGLAKFADNFPKPLFCSCLWRICRARRAAHAHQSACQLTGERR